MVQTIEGLIVALSPIVHHGDEKTGSTPTLRTMPYWDGQKFVQMPYIAGNAIRGVLRRLLMDDLMTHLDYAPTTKLIHILYSGGVLEAGDSVSVVVSPQARQALRDAIPPLGLLGASVGNQILSGSLCVDHALPVCMETRWSMPEWVQSLPEAQVSARQWTTFDFATRRDEVRGEREEGEQAVQMKIEFECFAAGAHFYHRFTLRKASPLEASALGRALQLWTQHPYIGGKNGAGYGRVRLDYPDMPDQTPYLEYLAQRADRVRETLDAIAKEM